MSRGRGQGGGRRGGGRGRKGGGRGGGSREGGGGRARDRGGKRPATESSKEQGLAVRVIEALSCSKRGPLKAKELARIVDVDPARYRDFRRLLGRLERAGTIYRAQGRRYAVAASLDLVSGRISVTRDGHGFVRPDAAGEDVYVPAHRLATAMDGDHVVARIERRPRGRSREGSVIRVLERARESVVGTLHRGRKVTYVVPLDARLRRDVLVTSGGEGGAEDGQVVVVRLTSYGEGRMGPAGEVERVLGQLSDPGVDVLAVAHGYGLSLEFTPTVLADAERAASVGRESPGADRVDRTDLVTFTIDPADAKDHDDALSLVELEDGVVEVGVHIADVSHYVRPGSAVDVEAAARATSVYLVDRTIPMLPPVLSNDVCSLNPDRERFAVSVFVHLDRRGNVLDRRYERTVIRCRFGLSYEEAQEVLDGAGSVSGPVDRALRLLDDRARELRRRRQERGALDLDLPEAKVLLDDEGAPIDIRRRERHETHRLIEDYMILANEVVAADLESRDLTTMYRIHEPPAREKVEALSETLSHYGLKIAKRKALRPSDLQDALDASRGRPEEAVVSRLVLRSLAKARYHTENFGHFGLASEGYVHFTSPIRRYPDLVAHRVVTDVLIGGGPEPYPDRDLLASEAEVCSAREQAAEEAERASVAMKKVEFMERHLGEVFEGRISGVAAFGFFVELEEFFVEGLVHVSGLHDDYYHFREREHRLVGERGGRSFRLGERVEVQVARVDKEARHVDFVLLRKRGPRFD